MKAAVYRQGELVVDTIEEPVPRAGQALVRTLACGICGSDLHFRRHACEFVEIAVKAGSDSFAMDLSRDVVLGHEFCAEVVDYGPGTQRSFRPGAVVCSVPSGVVNGQPRTIGLSNELPGGFGEYMALTEALMLEVPNGLPPAHAALTEPMAVGWHAIKLARLTPAHVALVLGCGPVGLAVVASLKKAGVGPVVAADFSPARRRLAEVMGADVVVDPKEQSPYEAWGQAAGKLSSGGVVGLLPRGDRNRPCVIFECVGVPGMIQQVMEGAPRGAEIIVVGACMERDTIEPMLGIYKALSLKFALAYSPQEYAEMLGFLGEGAIDVAPLVTGRVGLEQVPAAFDALSDPEAHAKIVVEPWR